MEHIDRPTIEQVAVLLKDIRLRAFVDDGIGRQHDDVLILLDGHMKPHPLPRSESPDDERA